MAVIIYRQTPKDRENLTTSGMYYKDPEGNIDLNPEPGKMSFLNKREAEKIIKTLPDPENWHWILPSKYLHMLDCFLKGEDYQPPEY